MNHRSRTTSKQAVPLFLCVIVAAAHAQQAPESPANDPMKFELSTIIKSLMISKSKKTGFQGDYLYFKSFLSGIRLLSAKEINTPSPEMFPGRQYADEYLYIYEGKLPILVKGQRFLAENMDDKYLWSVHFAGPKAYVSTVYIHSEKPVVISAGASYFSAAGMKLDALSCTSEGSSTNYSAYYRVSVPGKYPIVLGILKSTGSGGVWYSYEVSWYGVKAARLDKDAILGMCDIVD